MNWLACIAVTYVKIAQFYVMFFTYDKSLLATKNTWAWKFIEFMILRKKNKQFEEEFDLGVEDENSKL